MNASSSSDSLSWSGWSAAHKDRHSNIGSTVRFVSEKEGTSGFFYEMGVRESEFFGKMESSLSSVSSSSSSLVVAGAAVPLNPAVSSSWQYIEGEPCSLREIA